MFIGLLGMLRIRQGNPARLTVEPRDTGVWKRKWYYRTPHWPHDPTAGHLSVRDYFTLLPSDVYTKICIWCLASEGIDAGGT